MLYVFFAVFFIEKFSSRLFSYIFPDKLDIYPVWGLRILYNFGWPSKLLHVVGAWTILGGIILTLMGLLYIDKRHSGLITRGVYSKIRHPHILGFILYTVGWQILLLPTLISLLMLPFVISRCFRQALREDRNLRVKYGEAYLSYSVGTGLLLPRGVSDNILTLLQKTGISRYFGVQNKI